MNPTLDVYGVIIAYKDIAMAMRAQESAHRRQYPNHVQIDIHNNTEKNENIHVLWNRYWQLGMAKGAKYFVILNPDTRCEPGWLHSMLWRFSENNRLEGDPLIAAVGPSTDNCYNEQRGRRPREVFRARGSWVPNVLLPGFCTVFSMQALKYLGGWREDYDFYGGDLDLIIRLRLAGYMTAWQVDSFVWHAWGGAAKELGDERYTELRQLGNIQLQMRIREYGGLPGEGGQEGLWIAKAGGGVTYVKAPWTVTGEGQDHAGGESGERSSVDQEAAGTLRGDRLGEDAQESQEKADLTENQPKV